MKNSTGVALYLSSANNSSFDICLLSKTQLPVRVQFGGFLGRIFDPLMKVLLPLMKILLTQLAKRVLSPLALTVAVSAVDAAVKKN